MSPPADRLLAARRPLRRPFRLVRYFSITSLFGIVLVVACLVWTYRDLTERHLIAHESRANADLTRAFANTVWGNYREYVIGSAGRSREALLTDPAVRQLRADVMSKMAGLQIAKIKVYNLDGLTVFSTDEKQIGEDKSKNQGFIDAKAGQVVSQITFREKFDAFEGQLNNRNMIASYIPARASANGRIEGVFEVYSDVTELLSEQRRAQWQAAGLVLAALGTLYLFLSLVVRKADRILARHEGERAAREDQVRHQAYHDALTGLPNRAYFTERLNETILTAKRTSHGCALMFVDLDRFKIVNDSLGHEAGDRLLREVSGRIQAALRESDLLFRMGGDEFTVVLPQIAGPDDAALVARRVQDAVATPVSVHEHEVTVGATIGIAVYPGDGNSAESLLKNADAAMYSAKESGRGRHVFYRRAMNQRASQRLELEADLRRGFQDGEFALYYQKRIDAAQRRVVGVEALLRWQSPTRGLVPPGEFIHVLEDTGMMNLVGEWVLRAACSQAVQWRTQGMAPLRVSVNVSSVQFQNAGFVPMVRRVLRETGAAPELIELELTESLLIANIEQACHAIDALKALGLHVSIDDFGTGYSSLNYLRKFNVDHLKIDRSFAVDIANSPRDRAVIKAIVDVARALDIAVVAEGVETEAQAAFFASVQCDELQGYFFGRPMPVAQLEQHLKGALRHASEIA